MFQKLKNISIGGIFKKNKNFSFSPAWDWAVLVVIFLAANLALIALLTLNYFKILNETMSTSAANFQKIEPLNKEALDSVLDRFDQKKVRYESLLKGAPKTSDPAI